MNKLILLSLFLCNCDFMFSNNVPKDKPNIVIMSNSNGDFEIPKCKITKSYKSK